MMLAFIALVLVGTSEFEHVGTKETWMALLGVVAAGAIVLKIIQARRPKQDSTLHAQE